MSQTVNWRLPGEALPLGRIERLAQAVAERAGLEFHWYELDPEADDRDLDDDAPLPPPRGEGFVNVCFIFAAKRRLDALWKVEPAKLPRDLAALDQTFQLDPGQTEYTVELTFLRDEEPSGAPHCRLWVDSADASNGQAWPVALALGALFARELGGTRDAGHGGPSDDREGGRT